MAKIGSARASTPSRRVRRSVAAPSATPVNVAISVERMAILRTFLIPARQAAYLSSWRVRGLFPRDPLLVGRLGACVGAVGWLSLGGPGIGPVAAAARFALLATSARAWGVGL